MIIDPVQALRYYVVIDSYTFSVEEVIKKYGFCRSWIYELRKRFSEEGVSGVLPRSKAPKHPCRKVTPRVEHLIVYFKKKLDDWGATRIRNVLSYLVDKSRDISAAIPSTTVFTVWILVSPPRFSGFSVNDYNRQDN